MRSTKGKFGGYGHPKVAVARTRHFQTSSDGHSNPSPATSKPKPVASRQPHSPQQPQHRHQVQERSESLSVPGFNPPGGGGGPGPGGTSIFQLTRSPLFDAALTTIIGLGMGKYTRSVEVWARC